MTVRQDLNSRAAYQSSVAARRTPPQVTLCVRRICCAFLLHDSKAFQDIRGGGAFLSDVSTQGRRNKHWFSGVDTQQCKCPLPLHLPVVQFILLSRKT